MARNIIKISVKEDGPFFKAFSKIPDIKLIDGQIWHIDIEARPEDGDIVLTANCSGLDFVRYGACEKYGNFIGTTDDITKGELPGDFEFSPELASDILQTISNKSRRDIFAIESLANIEAAFDFMSGYFRLLQNYYNEFYLGNEYADLIECGYEISYMDITNVGSSEPPVVVDNERKIILLNEQASDIEIRQALKKAAEGVMKVQLVG